MDIEKIRKKLKEDLTKKRYEHTLGVAYTAASMAMCYGEDMNKAFIAGMLHDCAKCLSDDERRKAIKKYDIKVTDTEKKNPELLHAKIGAAFAKDLYDVDDKDILSAIRWHTTGKADMTPLEEIVFIADYIEPNRKPITGLDEIRYLAFNDRTKCILQIIENTLKYLEAKKSLVDEGSTKTYEFYKKKYEDNQN